MEDLSFLGEKVKGEKGMIIMRIEATNEEVENVVKEVARFGLRCDVSRGEYLTIIGLIGDESRVPLGHFAAMAGVKETRNIQTPYKLISREYTKEADRNKTRIIRVGDVAIG